MAKHTTVYRITVDGNQFQQLEYVEPFALEHVRFNGRSRIDSWVARSVRASGKKLSRPDIWTLAGASALVFDSVSRVALEPYLSRAGELLPLLMEDGSSGFALLNVTTCVDCLNADESVLGPVRWRLAFDADRVPVSGFFKIPQSPVGHVLMVSRSDEEDSFRLRVERRGLRGIELEEVWSSSVGATPFSLFRF